MRAEESTRSHWAFSHRSQTRFWRSAVEVTKAVRNRTVDTSDAERFTCWIRMSTKSLIERWRNEFVQPVPHRWWVADHSGSIALRRHWNRVRDPSQTSPRRLTIAVDPPYWRAGIGKALISLALRFLVADGYHEGILWTVEGYERGIAFYEAMGWRRDGGVRDGGRQIRFRRDLDALRMPHSPQATRRCDSYKPLINRLRVCGPA